MKYFCLAFFLFCFSIQAQEKTENPGQSPKKEAVREQGIIERIPNSFDRYIPGVGEVEAPRVKETPPPKGTETLAKTEKKEETKPDAKGKSFFESFVLDRSLLNGLILLVLVIVFILYRLRSGSRRGS